MAFVQVLIRVSGCRLAWQDPNETRDLASELPDVLHSLKTRYLELRATAYDQLTPIRKSREPAFRQAMDALYSSALRAYGGFQGPFWGPGAPGGTP